MKREVMLMKRLTSTVLSAVIVFISVFSVKPAAYAQSYEDKLLSYFMDKIEKDGEYVLEARSQFWHCYK